MEADGGQRPLIRRVAARLPRLRLPHLDASAVRSTILPPAQGAGTSGRLPWPPSPFALSLGVVIVATVFLAALTYYGAREFSGRAADKRASNEAMSFAAHSSRLATGDAFNGYIQILRYADDPFVRHRATSANERTTALQNLLLINVNKFQSLTVADRTGLILATTDASIDVRGSQAFSETRANLGPVNSDVMLPQAGKQGYIEFTAPLRDDDGTIWGILLGRAAPASLWKETLLAGVDGSTNVIINAQGQFAAGVPDELLRLPWQGVPLSNGSVRANIAGVDSICGLAPIGANTQIDRGLNVASCLPVSLIQAERAQATDKQALVTLAAVVLVVVVSTIVLLLGPGSQAPAPADDRARRLREPLVADAGTSMAPADQGEALPSNEISVEPPEPVIVYTAPPPDLDALSVIDAYERRSARLAERLRETLQAKLLIATSQATEAFRLSESDPETSAHLHERAIEQLEALREHDLRAIGQELYPALVRLGLPGALRALTKDVADIIEIELDLDATADSVEASAGRGSLAPDLRLALYRCVHDAVLAFATAGADRCWIALHRESGEVELSAGAALEGASQLEEALFTSRLAIDAYAGSLRITHAEGSLSVVVRVAAGEAREVIVADAETPGELDVIADAEMPGDLDIAFDQPASAVEGDLADDLVDAFAGTTPALADADVERPTASPSDAISSLLDADDDDGHAAPAPQATHVVTLPLEGVPTVAASSVRHSLLVTLEEVRTELFGALIVTLDVDPAAEARLSHEAMDAIIQLARTSLIALRNAEAERCTVRIEGVDDIVEIEVTSATAMASMDSIEQLQPSFTTIDGTLTVERGADGVQVRATLTVPSAAAVEDHAVDAA